MSGNPRGSAWRSTPDAAPEGAPKRGRPRGAITLSPKAWDRLDELAHETGKSRGRLIEDWIWAGGPEEVDSGSSLL